MREVVRWGLVGLTVGLVGASVVVALAGGEVASAWGFPLSSSVWGLAFAGVGVVVDRARPENPIGRLFLVAGVLFGALELAQQLPSIAGPDTGVVLFQAVNFLWMPPILLVFEALARFPDGRVSRPWVRWALWVGWLAVGAAIVSSVWGPALGERPNPWEIASLSAVLRRVQFWSYLPFQLATLGPVAGFIVRYRSESAEVKVQMRWVAWAVSVMLVTILTVEVGLRLADARVYAAATSLTALSVLLIPVAMMVAITRYRLYDIDRLVNRTVVYVTVVAVLVGVYAAGLGLLTQLLPVESNLAVAASTLVVAGLFDPVRRRVQGWVDRRFFRSRYRAQEELESLAARLREEQDLEVIEEDLRSVLDRTLAPASAGIWIREAP